MGLFSRSNKHGRRIARERREGAYAPGTRLSYDPALIDRFKGQHHSLLKLFEKVQHATEARDFEALKYHLEQFKRVLQEHLLEENLRLYAYLTKCLESEPENYRLMRDMKSEMLGIGRQVNEFISHYTKGGIDHGNIAEFERRLNEIGGILTVRIRREEESLYTLYMPPDQYL